GDSAFRDCESLANITIPSSVTSIISYAFDGCTSLENIAIPSSVTSIGVRAFRNCTSLKAVMFSADSKLERIGDSAFFKCTGLESIAIPSSVKIIDDDAFNGCTDLVTVTFAGTPQLTSIGANAFAKCTSLASITIPSAVTSVSFRAFYGCTSLEEVEFLGATPPTFDHEIFADSTAIAKCYVPYGTKTAYTKALTDMLPSSAEIIERPDPNPPTEDVYYLPQPSVAGGIGWSAVNNAISNAPEGSDVAINMNGTTQLPKNVLNAVKGKDINLVITMSNGYVWTINGKDITETKNIDLTVKKPLTQRIPTSVLDILAGEKHQLQLGFEGNFGFKAMLTVPLGSTNSGQYANLYYYNPATKMLEYVSSGKIGTDGKAGLDFTHASDYAITITSELPTDDEPDNSGEEPNSDDNPITGAKRIPFEVILLITTGVILIARKKAKQS
ncbi:MAG TPA: leucine-rich repeat domain-containing protein, partial [Oscillospiraceae bacterium]|nr:leucine-rich repeat domain-containing protein [Oscillospiraceae bacterium]